MAWTAPRTWVVGEVVTAALGNVHWRDNLLQTAPALVTTKGDIVVATAANTIARLAVGANNRVPIADSAEATGLRYGPVTPAEVQTKATVALADAAATLTAAQMVGSSGGVFTITPTVARILTTDTATAIASALTGSQAGTWRAFTIINLAAFNVTLAAGTGVTLTGRMVINNESSTWLVRVDSSTTVTIYSMALAAAASGGGGAVTRAGGNTTEATTTSTVAVDVLTVAALSIAVGVPVKTVSVSRKSTGAADGAYHGLKLNTTEVRTIVKFGTGANAVESAGYIAEFIYGVTNYLRAGRAFGWQSDSDTAFNIVNQYFPVDMPTATLTDVVIRGTVGNGSTTMGADECHVYTHSVS